MKADKSTVVGINYTLKNKDGEIIDQSNGNVLEFIPGTNYLLTKMEEACIGKEEGESFELVIDPKDGYGEYSEDLLQDIPRENFETDQPIEPGMMFQAYTPAGPRIVTVKEVNEKTVKIDANHELAGVTLYFTVEIASVRQATQDELEKGLFSGNGCGCGCGGDCGGDCGDGGCGCGGGCGGCGN